MAKHDEWWYKMIFNDQEWRKTAVEFIIKMTKMKKNKWILPFLGTVLMGLSTYVLVTVVELQVHLGMLSEEIMSIDKQIGRIYAHMDRLMK